VNLSPSSFKELHNINWIISRHSSEMLGITWLIVDNFMVGTKLRVSHKVSEIRFYIFSIASSLVVYHHTISCWRLMLKMVGIKIWTTRSLYFMRGLEFSGVSHYCSWPCFLQTNYILTNQKRLLTYKVPYHWVASWFQKVIM
jgi:hypothetical protein